MEVLFLEGNYNLIYVNESTSKLLQSIKSERKKLGVSRKELAAILGINYFTLSNYENGLYTPLLPTFLKLAEFFDWDISHNVNFLFAKFGHNTRFLRKIKQSYGLTNKQLASLMNIDVQNIQILFRGKGTIKTFAKFLHVIYYLSRKKVLS